MTTKTKLYVALAATLSLALSTSAQQPPGAPIVQPAPQPTNYLAWSADAIEYAADAGEMAARFIFYVTNVSTEVVVIHNLARACGCTEATMPETPWQLAPGTNGPITATIDLRGKSGRISKTLTVNGSAGSKVLYLNVTIPAAAPATGSFNIDRDRNLERARVKAEGGRLTTEQISSLLLTWLPDHKSSGMTD